MRRFALVVLITTIAIASAVGVTSKATASSVVAEPTQITQAGTYNFVTAAGLPVKVVVTDSGPIAQGVRSGALVAGASYPWCRFVTYNRDIDLTTFDYLQATLCWNGSTTNASNVKATCQTGALPSGVCYSQRWGIQGNYTRSVMAWGNYVQNTDWFLGDNEGLAISGNYAGKWWVDAWGMA